MIVHGHQSSDYKMPELGDYKTLRTTEDKLEFLNHILIEQNHRINRLEQKVISRDVLIQNILYHHVKGAKEINNQPLTTEPLKEILAFNMDVPKDPIQELNQNAREAEQSGFRHNLYSPKTYNFRNKSQHGIKPHYRTEHSHPFVNNLPQRRMKRRLRRNSPIVPVSTNPHTSNMASQFWTSQMLDQRMTSLRQQVKQNMTTQDQTIALFRRQMTAQDQIIASLSQQVKQNLTAQEFINKELNSKLLYQESITQKLTEQLTHQTQDIETHINTTLANFLWQQAKSSDNHTKHLLLHALGK